MDEVANMDRHTLDNENSVDRHSLNARQRGQALVTVRRQRIPDFRRPDLRESFDSSGLLSGGFLSVV